MGELVAAVAAERTEDIAGKAFRMNPDQYRFAPVDIAFDNSKVVMIVDFAFIQFKSEITEFCREIYPKFITSSIYIICISAAHINAA